MKLSLILLGAALVLTTHMSEAAAEEEGAPAAEEVPATTAVALTGMYGVVNSSHAQVFRGLELDAVTILGGKTYVGVVAGVSEGINTSVTSNYIERRPVQHYDHAFWDVWFGPQLAWGAPYRHSSRWGVALKTGLAGGNRDTTLYSAFRNNDAAYYVSAFGVVSLRLAVCGCTTWRPFIGASGRTVLSHYGDFVQSAGLDLGLALAP